MANRLTNNPIYFDQFDADTTLAEEGKRFIVKKIRMLSAADGDDFVLEDMNDNVLFHMMNTGNADTVEVNFGDEGFDFGSKGIRIDVSDCTGMDTTDGTDAVWIYLA